MNLICLSNQNDRDLILKFYKDNASEFVTLNRLNPARVYYKLEKDGEIMGMVSTQHVTDNLIGIWSSTVKRGYRGQGFGKEMNRMLEDLIYIAGYRKITSHIYIDNIASLVVKLKAGFIIEGTLKDHDEIGQHEYILGKVLGEEEDV